MSHLEHSNSQDHIYLNHNPTNPRLLRNPQHPLEFRNQHSQLTNDMSFVRDKNLQLKTDYANNKAKLLANKPNNIVQHKRMSSMENIQITQHWTNQQQHLQFNQPLHFRKTTHQFVNNNFVPQQRIVPQPNQQNQGDFINIQQTSTKTTVSIESLNNQIREYSLKIQQLERSQQNYLEEIADYKEIINRVQSVMHEKEALVMSEKTKNLKQKEAISELENQLLQYKSSKEIQLPANKSCSSCEEMTKRIAKMTKQITELTNQLNSKTEKLKLVQSSEKSLNSLQTKNQQFQAQITKMTLEFERRTFTFQTQISKLRERLSVNASNSNFEQEMQTLRESNLHLKEELKESDRLARLRFTELMQQNQRLSSEVDSFKHQAEQRHDSSSKMSSSQHESVFYEYQRSIQILQEEIHSLRQQIDLQGRIGADESENKLQQAMQHIEHLTLENSQLSERVLMLDGQINRLGQELSVTQQRYGSVMQEKHSLQQSVDELRVKLQHSASQHVVEQKIRTQKSQEEYKKQISMVQHELLCSKKMIAELFAKVQMLQSNEEDTKEEEKKVRRYQETIQKQAGDIETLNGQLRQVKMSQQPQMTAVSRRLNEQQLRSTHLQQEMHTLRQTIFTLEQQLKLSNQKYEESYSGLVRAENYIEEQQKRVNELENEINIMSIPQGNQEHHVAQLNHKLSIIAQLEQELAKIHQQSAFFNNQLQRVNQVNVQLQKTNTLLNDQKNHFTLRINQTDLSLRSAQENITRLNSQLTAAKSQFTSVQRELTSVQRELTLVKSEISSLKTQKTILMTRIHEFQAKPQLITDTQQIQRLQQQILSLQREREAQNATTNSIEQKLLEAQNFILVVNQELALKTHEVNQIKEMSNSVNNSQELQHLRAFNNQLQNDLEALQRDNLNLQSLLASKDQELTRFRTYEQQVLTLNQQLSSKSSELTQVQTLLSSQSATLSHKQQEIDRLKQTQLQLSRSLSLQQNKQQDPNQNLIVNEMNQQLANSQRMVEQLQNQKNTLHQHLMNAENYIYEFEQKNYTQILDELHFTINSLTEQRNTLLAKQQQLEHLVHTRDQHHPTETQEYEHKINSYLQQIALLKNQITIIDSEIIRLNTLNSELQAQVRTLNQENSQLRNLQQTLVTRHAQDIEKIKLRVKQLETQRETFLQNVDHIKTKLIADQPQTIIQLDQSRVKVDKFIEENHRIIENLKKAEGHIKEMELRCEEYLAEIERLKNGIITNFSMRDSKRTIINVLDDESQFEKTPIKKIDNSSFDQSSGPRGFRQSDSLLYRIGDLEEIILVMKRQIEGRDDYIRNIENKINSLEGEKANLQEKVTRLTQAISTHEVTVREVSAFDNQKREFERLIVQLNNQKAILKSENQRLNDVVASKSSELLNVENKWHDIKHNTQEIERRNATLAEEIRVAKTQTQQNQVHLLELQNLRTTISGLETHIREFERANGSLIEENRAFSSRLQQNDFQSSEVQNLRTTISGLEKAYETEIHNLKGRIESLKNQLGSVQSENSRLMNEIQAIATRPQQSDVYLIEIQRLKETIAFTENEQNKVSQQNQSLKGSLQSALNQARQGEAIYVQNQQLKQYIDQMQVHVKAVESENRELIDKIIASEAEPGRNEVFLAQNQNLKTAVANLELQIHEKDQQNAGLMNQIRVLSQGDKQIDQYRREVANLKGKVSLLEEQVKKGDGYVRENNETKTFLVSLEEKLMQTEQEKGSLLNELGAISSRLNEREGITNETHELKLIISTLQTHSNNLNDELLRLQAENSHLQTSLQTSTEQLASQSAQLSSLQNTLASLESNFNKSVQENSHLQNHISDLQTINQSLNQKLAELDNKSRSLEQTISSTIVINPSHDSELNLLRSEVVAKEQKVQEVIAHLNMAEQFIASNQATFLKAEQDKVEMANKIVLLEKHVGELATVNGSLLKDISEKHQPAVIEAEMEKTVLQLKLVELERNLDEISSQNTNLQLELQLALEVKPHQQPKNQDEQIEEQSSEIIKSLSQANIELKQEQQNLSSEIQEWQQQVTSLNSQIAQLKKVETQFKDLTTEHQKQRDDFYKLVDELNRQKLNHQNLSDIIDKLRAESKNSEVRFNNLVEQQNALREELKAIYVAEFDDLQARFDTVQKELTSAKSQLSNLRHELLIAQTTPLEDNQDLQSQRNLHREIVDNINSDHQNQLQKVAQTLKSEYQCEFEKITEKINTEHQQELNKLAEKLESDHELELKLLAQQHVKQLETIRASLNTDEQQVLEKINDENRFLQDSIAQLNELIEKDRKTINDLRDQMEQANQRHIEEVIHLRNELEQTLSSQQDTDYVNQLEAHIKLLQNQLQLLQTKHSSNQVKSPENQLNSSENPLNSPQLEIKAPEQPARLGQDESSVVSQDKDKVHELELINQELSDRLNHAEQVKSQIYLKLRQAEDYILYIEQQKLTILANTPQNLQGDPNSQIIQGVPEEVHNEVLQRLVDAQSIIFQLQKQPAASSQISEFSITQNDTLIKERDNLIVQFNTLSTQNQTLLTQKLSLQTDNSNLTAQVAQLQKQLSELFHKHDQKLQEMTQRNSRIQEELQLTVVRVSEEHMQLLVDIDSLTLQNQTLQDQLAQAQQNPSPTDTTQQQTNARVLQEMRATISRISQENKILLQENQELEDLKEQLQQLQQTIEEKNTSVEPQIENINRELAAKILQVQEFEMALAVQTKQVYEASSELAKTQDQLNSKQFQIVQTTEQLQKLTETNGNLASQNQLLKEEVLKLSHLTQQNETLRAQLVNLSVSPSSHQPNNYSKMSESLHEITNSLQQKSQLINSLNASLDNERNKSASVQKARKFFETKLLEAEDYILENQKDKRELAQKYQQLHNQLERMKLIKIQERPDLEGDSISANNSLANISAITQNDEKYKELKQTAENLQSMIDELQMTITELQVEIDSKDHQLAEKRKEVNSLKQTIKNLQSQKQSLSQNIDNLNTIISNLNENITGLNQNITNLTDNMNQVSDKNSSLTQNVTDLHTIINNLEKELTDERQIKEHLKNALQESTVNENNQKETQNLLASLEQTVEAKEKEIAALKDSIVQLEDEKLVMEQSGREAFSRQLQAHKRLNEELIRANKENANELNLLRSKALEATELKHSLNGAENRIKEIQNELKQKEFALNNLNVAIELMRGEKSGIENERDSLVENQVSLTQEREEYSRANSQLTQQMVVLGKHKQELDAKLEEEREEKQRMNKELLRRQEEEEKYVEEIRHLLELAENQKYELEFLKDRKISSSEETETLKKLVEENSKQLEESSKQLEESSKQLEEMSKELEESKRQVEEKRGVIEQYERELNQEKKQGLEKDRVITQLKVQVDDFKVQFIKSDVRVEELKLQVDKQTNGAKEHVRKALEHVKRASEVELALKQANSQLQSTHSQLQANQSQITNLTNQLNQAKLQLAQSAPQILQLQEMTPQLQQLNEMIILLQTQLAEAKAQNDQLVEQLVEAESQLTKHPLDLKNLEKQKNTQIHSLTNKLNASNDQINSLNDQLHPVNNQAAQSLFALQTLENQVTQKDTQIQTLQSQLAEKETTISQQQQLLNAADQLSDIKIVYEQQITDNANRIQDLLNQLNSAHQQNDQLSQESSRMNEQLNQKVLEFIMKEEEMNSLKDKISEQIEKISEQNEKISEQNGEINQFISLHEHLMEEISEERMKLEKKEEELDELSKLLAQRGRQQEPISRELGILKAQLQSKDQELENMNTLKQRLIEAESYIKTLEGDSGKLHAKVVALQEKASSAQILKQSVDQKSDLLSSRELQISSMSLDLKDISLKLNDKEQELLLSQNELIQIRQKISQLENQIQHQEHAKTQLKHQLDSSLENSHELTLLNDRLTETQKQLLAVQVDNQDLQNRNQELAESVIQLEVLNSELTSTANDLQLRNNQLLSSLQKLNTEFNDLEQQNTHLKNQLKLLETRLQTIIEEHSQNQSDQSQEQQQEIQELKLKLLQKEQELEHLRDQAVDLNLKMGNYEEEMENYRKIIEEQGKQNEVEHEIENLRENLKNADDYIASLDTQVQEMSNTAQQLHNQNNTLKLEIIQHNQSLAQLRSDSLHDNAQLSQLQLAIDQLQSEKKQLQETIELLDSTIEDLKSTIAKLQSSPKSSTQSKITSEDSHERIVKIVQKLTKYVDEHDSLDFFQEQNIQKDLTSSPLFKNLYETIKYRLKLLNAIDKEKSVTLSEKDKNSQELINSMKKLEDQQQEMYQKVSQAEILETSYHEVLGKLIEMERLNLSLENEVKQLNNQLSLHKSQLEEFQSKLQNESSSLSAEVSGETERPEGQQGTTGGDIFIDEQLKLENLRLRKELEEALYELHKLRNNTSNFESFHHSPVISPLMNKRLNENSQFFKDFLRDCLVVIGNVEDNVTGIEKDLMGNRQSIERLLTNKNVEKPVLGSKGSEDSWMFEKIQQLQEKLLQNQKKLLQHKNQTEMQLINLVRDSVITPLTQEAQSMGAPLFDREKVESYLKDLEDIILRKDLAHDEQINRLKSISERQQHQRNDSSISPHKEFESQKAFDKDHLLKEIAGLNKLIQQYHHESDRRKAHYKEIIEELLKEIDLLKKQYETLPILSEQKTLSSVIDNIVAKAKTLMDQQSLEDFDDKSDYLNDDDFIVSNNYVQWISKKGGMEESPNKEEEHFVHDLKSIAEEFQNKESSIPSRNNLSNVDNVHNPTSVENRILNLSNNLSKEELLSKPILEFIIQNKDFDETQINLLKRKLNELQSKTNRQKFQLLKQHEQKVAEFLVMHKLVKDAESTQKQVQTEAAMNTLCANLTKEQVQKLVSEQELPEEMIIRIQEVFAGNSHEASSFLKSDSSAYEMTQNILEIKVKYYPEPTPLSEEMFHHLIKLLSSKDNQEFYALVDSLFSYLSMLENDFLNTLKQKEEMYQKHTEKMNQVLGLNDQSDDDLDLEDEEYYKRILLLTKDEQAEIQKLRREQTEQGISEQLEEQLRKAVDEQNE